jgi:hypothetical protein
VKVALESIALSPVILGSIFTHLHLRRSTAKPTMRTSGRSLDIPKNGMRPFAFRLSSEDQKKFDAHPAIAWEMLPRIPRLEAIALMIAGQNNPDPKIEARNLEEKECN